jgi:hypothetical protein
MSASWYARGAVSARLLGVRRFGTAKAAPKRYQQADFQYVPAGSNCWKVPTAGDIQSMLPPLYLLQHKQQMAGSSSDRANSSSESSDADSESDSSGAADASRSSRGGSREGRGGSARAGTSISGASQQEFWLSHTKPRKARNAKQQGPAARIVLTLRLLSGYDQRHSLQVRQGGRCYLVGVQVAMTLWLLCARHKVTQVPFMQRPCVCCMMCQRLQLFSTQHPGRAKYPSPPPVVFTTAEHTQPCLLHCRKMLRSWRCWCAVPCWPATMWMRQSATAQTLAMSSRTTQPCL